MPEDSEDPEVRQNPEDPGRRRFAKLPDWLVYVAILAALVIAAVGRRENADAPPAPPPLSNEEGRLLPSASTFSPKVVVKVSSDPGGPLSGTAFSIGPKGLWLTARHVVAGCGKVALMEAPGKAAAAQVLKAAQPAQASQAAAASDVAVLLTEGGAPALPLGLGTNLRVGERGFHPGFPQGRAGEATTRLLGRQTLEFRAAGMVGRGAARRESVLSWAEAGRTGGLRGDLSGLSGAPALDARGQVVGVTLAEAPRRGRIYSASLDSVLQALGEAGLKPPNPPSPIDPISVDNYGRVADTLRRDLSIAEVVCLDGQ